MSLPARAQIIPTLITLPSQGSAPEEFGELVEASLDASDKGRPQPPPLALLYEIAPAFYRLRAIGGGGASLPRCRRRLSSEFEFVLRAGRRLTHARACRESRGNGLARRSGSGRSRIAAGQVVPQKSVNVTIEHIALGRSQAFQASKELHEVVGARGFEPRTSTMSR